MTDRVFWSLFVVAFWVWTMFIGLWMRAQRRDELTIGDFAWSLFFGPLYMLSGFDSWDAVIWKRNKK